MQDKKGTEAGVCISAHLNLSLCGGPTPEHLSPWHQQQCPATLCAPLQGELELEAEALRQEDMPPACMAAQVALEQKSLSLAEDSVRA